MSAPSDEAKSSRLSWVRVGHLAGHVGGEPHHLVERDRPRIHLEDRGHDLLADRDRMQARVLERVAERAELGLHQGLHLRVGHRPPVGGLQALAEQAGQVREVGRAESASEVAGRAHAGAGQDPDPEGEGVVVAGGLGLAVLGARELALADLDAHVGVAEVGERARVPGDEFADHRGDGLDQPGLDAVRHAAAQDTANGSTDTVSPAAMSPRSSSITTKQLASVIEVRMPEPCGPVVRTSQRSPA